MRQAPRVLALAALTLALHKGLLVFQEVESPYEVNGTLLLYIYQSGCEECKRAVAAVGGAVAYARQVVLAVGGAALLLLGPRGEA